MDWMEKWNRHQSASLEVSAHLWHPNKLAKTPTTLLNIVFKFKYVLMSRLHKGLIASVRERFSETDLAVEGQHICSWLQRQKPKLAPALCSSGLSHITLNRMIITYLQSCRSSVSSLGAGAPLPKHAGTRSMGVNHIHIGCELPGDGIPAGARLPQGF